MALIGDVRAQTIYNVVAQGPTFGKLNPAEAAGFLSSLKAIFGADTTYITANAVVLPSALTVPPAIPVQVAILSGTGATTGPGSVIGTGKVS